LTAICENDTAKARALMGGKISKQYFEEVVQENIDLLGLSRPLAVQETLEQFKAQGIPIDPRDYQA